jgi:hypothetical protein
LDLVLDLTPICAALDLTGPLSAAPSGVGRGLREHLPPIAAICECREDTDHYSPDSDAR